MYDMSYRVVVIGGGVAGMEAAAQLAGRGCKVTVFEKEAKTGGHGKNWFHLFQDRKDSREVLKYLDNKINHSNITLLTGVPVERINTSNGLLSLFAGDGKEITADAVVIATGFDLFRSEKK